MSHCVNTFVGNQHNVWPKLISCHDSEESSTDSAIEQYLCNNMGFFDNVGADLLHALKTEVVNNLPILKDNESYLSDIDLYLAVINAFDELKYFNNDIISDIALVGSHMEFQYSGIPIALFNMASHFVASAYYLPLAAQGILDMKETEISKWDASYEGKQHITMVLELGSESNFVIGENAFAKRASKADDCRFSIYHYGL